MSLWVGSGRGKKKIMATSCNVAVLTVATRAIRNVTERSPEYHECSPVFSPDGARIAFYRCFRADCHINVVPAHGGPITTLSREPTVIGNPGMDSRWFSGPLMARRAGSAIRTQAGKKRAAQIHPSIRAERADRYVSPYGVAQIYAALNQKEDTFKLLQAAYDDRAVWMGYWPST